MSLARVTAGFGGASLISAVLCLVGGVLAVVTIRTPREGRPGAAAANALCLGRTSLTRPAATGGGADRHSRGRSAVHLGGGGGVVRRYWGETIRGGPWRCWWSGPRAGRQGCGWRRCRWPGTRIRSGSRRSSAAASGRWRSTCWPRQSHEPAPSACSRHPHPLARPKAPWNTTATPATTKMTA